MNNLQKKKLSLKNWLLISLLTSMILIWSSASYLILKNSEYEITEMLNAELSQTALLLATLFKHKFDELPYIQLLEDKLPTTIKLKKGVERHYEHTISFQIFDNDGNLKYKSATAPDVPLSRISNVFRNSDIDGKQWHTYRIDSGKYQYHVGIEDNLRKELTEEIIESISIPMLFGLPLMAFLIWGLVCIALRPLVITADKIASQEPLRLSEIDARSLPAEIQPLIQAINLLIKRVRLAFENEREFTANAAHELRTPLATILVQSQVATSSTDEHVRTNALKKIGQTVDSTTRTLNQLLDLARADQSDDRISYIYFDLEETISLVAKDIIPLILEKDIEFSLQAEEKPYNISGNQNTLYIMCRNLIDNAVRYTPEGGTVMVSINHAEGGINLLIEDSGPGIPEVKHLEVMQRFHRDNNNETGIGLGFSIVQRIIKLHNGSMTLEKSDNLGGLKISIFLPQHSPSNRH